MRTISLQRDLSRKQYHCFLCPLPLCRCCSPHPPRHFHSYPSEQCLKTFHLGLRRAKHASRSLVYPAVLPLEARIRHQLCSGHGLHCDPGQTGGSHPRTLRQKIEDYVATTSCAVWGSVCSPYVGMHIDVLWQRRLDWGVEWYKGEGSCRGIKYHKRSLSTYPSQTI